MIATALPVGSPTRGGAAGGARSRALRLSARMLSGSSTAPRLQASSQGWKQTRPQIEGSGLSRRMTPAASAKRPAAIRAT
jgi:hypothetical protein